jgi:hypothetical protein
MPYQIDEKHLTIFPEYFVGVVKLAIIRYSNRFLLQADRGFASGADFFLGGKGAFCKKRCNAPRATDFREKRNPPQADSMYIHSYLFIYFINKRLRENK